MDIGFYGLRYLLTLDLMVAILRSDRARKGDTMRHTEQQVQDALTVIPMPDARTAKAWERINYAC